MANRIWSAETLRGELVRAPAPASQRNGTANAGTADTRCRGWHGAGDLSRGAGAPGTQFRDRKAVAGNWGGCAEREVPEAGTGPAAGVDLKAQGVGGSTSQRLAGAGGPDQCHGASTAPALREGQPDRAERELHGDAESRRRVRVPRTRSADSV